MSDEIESGAPSETILAETGPRPAGRGAPPAEAGPSYQVERTVVETVPAGRLSVEQAKAVAETLRKEYEADASVWDRDPTFQERYMTAVALAAGRPLEEATDFGEMDRAGRVVPAGTGEARVAVAFDALPVPLTGEAGWDRETHAAFCAFADEMQLAHHAVGEGYAVFTRAQARAQSGQGPDDLSWARPLDDRWGDRADQQIENAAYALEVLLHDDEPLVVRWATYFKALWPWDPEVPRFLADEVFPALERGNLGPSVINAIGRRALSHKAIADRQRAEGERIKQREAQERDEMLREAQREIERYHRAWGEINHRRTIR
jgi:hypothetical protein